MSASRVEEARQPKSRRKPAPQAQAASDPVAGVARIPAGAIRLRLNYADPLDYKPRTTDLSQLRMEFDDAQVLRYLYRNHAPKRHLEFGTWEGQGVLFCLQESPQATVWSLNLPDGETGSGEKYAYHRVYDVPAGAPNVGRYVSGDPVTTGTERRAYQTDAGAFIGHLVREANLGHRLCQIYGDSRAWDISPYPPGFFDSVLIDGGHDPETVISDTRKALILARPGGLVLWHDFCPDPAVFEMSDSSCRGVIEGLRAIWPEVAEKLADAFWVENTWLLVGVRAAEAAPAANQPAAADAEPRGAAALDGAVAALRAELNDFARQREARTQLEVELEATRARLAGAEEGRSHADRVAGQAHTTWLETIGGLVGQMTSLSAAQDRVAQALGGLQSELGQATQAARADASAISELAASEAEQRRVVASLRSELSRLERVVAERTTAAEQAEAEVLHLSIAETEVRASAAALRLELARRDETIIELAKRTEELRQRTEHAESEAARLDGESKARNLKIIDLDALRHVHMHRLEEGEAERARLQAALEDARAVHERLEGEGDSLRAELRSSIARLEREGDQARAASRDAEVQIAHLRDEGARLRQSLFDMEEGLAHVTRSRDQLRSHASALEASINEIRSSTSWRVTQPLRTMSTKLRPNAR